MRKDCQKVAKTIDKNSTYAVGKVTALLTDSLDANELWQRSVQSGDQHKTRSEAATDLYGLRSSCVHDQNKTKQYKLSATLWPRQLLR